MIYGYARVSTDAQDLAIQLDGARGLPAAKRCSTTRRRDSADRPQLKRLMKRLGAGDIVKAPATDRFARDPTDLLVLGRDIRTKGARFVSIAEPILDTDSEFWSWLQRALGLRPSSSCGASGSAQRRAANPPSARGEARAASRSSPRTRSRRRRGGEDVDVRPTARSRAPTM